MSGRQSESDSIEKQKIPPAKCAKDGSAGDAVPREKAVRKNRSANLGRALRSVYDDTLRESVPDDFLDLLGKLN